jgi:putative tryptophan/tyrosine transport system substrate-binding protein
MRRVVLLVVGLVTAMSFALPGGAQTKPGDKVYRVGTLFPSVVHKSFRMEEIRKALAEHGYAEGRNLVFESRLTGDNDFHRPDLAKELVESRVDLIVTIEITGGQAAAQATSTIPTIVLNCDPHEQLVASLARPGGNVTGQSCMNAELTPKKLETFKRGVPNMTRVAFLYNPRQPGPALGLKLAQDAARTLRLVVQPVEVTGSADFDQALERIAKGRFDGLFVYHDFVTAGHRSQIIAFAARTRLPAFYGYREWVDAGGLMSYGPDLRAMFARAGRQAARILGGAKAADLPVEQPTEFELFVNTKTAKALGFTIPSAVLLQANQLID